MVIMLKLEIDSRHGMAYLRLFPEPVVVTRTSRVTDNLILDFDARNRIVGVEVLNVEIVEKGKKWATAGAVGMGIKDGDYADEIHRSNGRDSIQLG